MARRKGIFIATVVALVAVAVSIVGFLAPEESSSRTPRRSFGEVASPISVRLTMDTLDATRGVLRVRVSVDTRDLPPEGATLFTDLPGIGSLSLPDDKVAADKISDVLVEAGDITDYPYDVYAPAFQLLAVPGRGAPLPPSTPTSVLPLRIEVVNALAGFRDASRAEVQSGVTVVSSELSRQIPAVVWASGMIAIYWLLAISAFAVMLATVLGLRSFETRHLAWLVAMIFAFSAFRTTAPGSPPVGVFIDFASFFWAEAIVAASLIALVLYYLTGDRGAPAAADADGA